MAEICRRMAEIPDWMLAASWTPPNISASQCRVIAIPGTSSLPFLFRLIGTFGDIRDVFGSQFASVRHKGRCDGGKTPQTVERWDRSGPKPCGLHLLLGPRSLEFLWLLGLLFTTESRPRGLLVRLLFVSQTQKR